MDDDELDGCELDFAADPTDETNVDMVVLFADCVHQDEVDARKAEWDELLR